MLGKFYIVATPIGNLKDITLRALEILKEVEVIACEDTRVTRKLLENYQIDKKLISFHQHSRPGDFNKIINEIRNNKCVAYLTDAGTPGISDPGNKLVEVLLQKFDNDIDIIPIPGPSAVIAALSVSGFPTDNFIFKGFIPHKKGRNKFLNEIKESKITTVFYESVHRVERLIKEMTALEIDKEIVLGREITKMFETFYRGKPSEIKLNKKEIKGEFVVIVRGK